MLHRTMQRKSENGLADANFHLFTALPLCFSDQIVSKHTMVNK
jgi:hypothetical protein